ncbi:hypothetical protein [Streptomyces albipurpureus]|uniref:Uncharacterized protein n=1 Tax=Streptomyces albipurpureus TaxID=2897419 RepID=A0ABT0UYG9_9ACTN|nr:hypothetical protein [Streptomyces sp. CWNU-1]MCM2393622.1 hypothetical protein [Streptomyces sp. CWNU-1]
MTETLSSPLLSATAMPSVSSWGTPAGVPVFVPESWRESLQQPSVSADLVARADSVRRRHRHWTVSGCAEVPGCFYAVLDEGDARTLRRIVLRHGWPGYRLVGGAGAEAAIDIAVNVSDPALLRRLLRLVDEAVGEGDAPWSGLPRLTNRLIALEQGIPALRAMDTSGFPRRLADRGSSLRRASPRTEAVAAEVLAAQDPLLHSGW